MRYECVIFDLDGTILNTLGDLKNATNATLEYYGYQPLTLEETRCFVGSGLKNLMRLAVRKEADDAHIARLMATFKENYGRDINVETCPYDGIADLFRTLRAAGIKVGVNTNKYHAAAEELCRVHFPSLPDGVVGEMEGSPKKPSPVGAMKLVTAFGCNPKRVLYVGDSDVDMQTAENSGFDFAWVSWGFRREDELPAKPANRFDTVEALKNFILG